MPYNRPGAVEVDVVATKQVNHGAITWEENRPGVTVKTKADAATAGLVTPPVIAIGEAFNHIVKGIVQITNPGGFVAGDPVYITKATNALNNTGPASATVGKVGVVSEIAGERGTPTGKMRVNLDLKDVLL